MNDTNYSISSYLYLVRGSTAKESNLSTTGYLFLITILECRPMLGLKESTLGESVQHDNIKVPFPNSHYFIIVDKSISTNI